MSSQREGWGSDCLDCDGGSCAVALTVMKDDVLFLCDVLKDALDVVHLRSSHAYGKTAGAERRNDFTQRLAHQNQSTPTKGRGREG